MAFAFHSLHSSSSSSLSTSSSRAGTRQYSSSSSSSIDRLRRRNLALSLVLVTPSGPISLPLPLQYPEIYDNLCLDSEDDDIYRNSNESLNSLPSSRPTTPSTLPTSNSVDSSSDPSMAYYTVSSVFNFMKSLVGYPTEPSSSTTTRVPRPTSRPQVVRTLSWVSQANQEGTFPIPLKRLLPVGLGWKFIRQMDESDVEDDEERLATSAERAAVVDTANVLNQTHNQYGNATGRSTAEEGVAYLKGSPKTLGWRVDERQEEAAWRTLMADAMEGSIFERVPEGQLSIDEAEASDPPVPQPVPQSKRDLYKLWLNHWDDENIDLIWRISVSLYGHHRWELVPVITGSGLGTSALSETESGPLYTTEDIGVDTSDLFYATHAETPIQTDEIVVPVKEYGEIAVQHEVDYSEIAIQSEKVGYDDTAVQSEKAVYGEIAIQSEPVLPPLDSTLNSPTAVDGQEHANPWAEPVDDQVPHADNVSVSSEHKDKDKRSLRSKLPRLASIASLRHKSSKASVKNDSSESVKLDSPASQGENVITASPRSSLSRSNSKDSLKSNGKTRSGTTATSGRVLKNSPSLRSIALEHNAMNKKQRSPSTTSLATATTTTKVAESPTISTEVPPAKTAPVTPVEETPSPVETATSRWWKMARSNSMALGGWRTAR